MKLLCAFVRAGIGTTDLAVRKVSSVCALLARPTPPSTTPRFLISDAF
jgi:hypothetical protein